MLALGGVASQGPPLAFRAISTQKQVAPLLCVLVDELLQALHLRRTARTADTDAPLKSLCSIVGCQKEATNKGSPDYPSGGWLARLTGRWDAKQLRYSAHGKGVLVERVAGIDGWLCLRAPARSPTLAPVMVSASLASRYRWKVGSALMPRDMASL